MVVIVTLAVEQGGDSCFRDGSGGTQPCPEILTLEDTCSGVDSTNVGCFVEGAICFQVENNTGECIPAVAPTPTATPEPDCTTDE